MQDNNFTLGEFILFLQCLPELNIVNNDATARNLKDASMRLISSIQNQTHMDIRDIKIDTLLDSYSDNADPIPSEATLNAYKSRMQSAIDKFLAYQTGNTSNATPTQPELKKERRKLVLKKKANTSIEGEVKTFELPIPLRGDIIVTIGNLPRDLTQEEAKRISNIVESFALPEGFGKE